MNKQLRPEMTGKEALAILHKAHNAVGWHLFSPDASSEEQTIRAQIHTAFRVLDLAMHGEVIRHRPLCGCCHVQLCPEDYVQVRIKGLPYASPACPACLERLKTEQLLEAIEIWNEERQQWEQKEVPR
jgi:hypothetical protein